MWIPWLPPHKSIKNKSFKLERSYTIFSNLPELDSLEDIHSVYSISLNVMN